MIGERIKQLRHQLGLTTRELAAKADITQSMISRYESGKVVPTKKVLKQLADALETTSEQLLEIRGEEGFNQKDFEIQLAKARTFDVAEKITISKLISTISKYYELKRAVKELPE